jgi:hypothetical protein
MIGVGGAGGADSEDAMHSTPQSTLGETAIQAVLDQAQMENAGMEDAPMEEEEDLLGDEIRQSPHEESAMDLE